MDKKIKITFEIFTNSIQINSPSRTNPIDASFERQKLIIENLAAEFGLQITQPYEFKQPKIETVETE